MVSLEIKNTSNYTGSITVDGVQVKTMSQSFDEKGHRNGSIGEYVMNKELYFENLEECRNQEDAFLEKMREVEDQAVAKERELHEV